MVGQGGCHLGSEEAATAARSCVRTCAVRREPGAAARREPEEREPEGTGAQRRARSRAARARRAQPAEAGCGRLVGVAARGQNCWRVRPLQGQSRWRLMWGRSGQGPVPPGINELRFFALKKCVRVCLRAAQPRYGDVRAQRRGRALSGTSQAPARAPHRARFSLEFAVLDTRLNVGLGGMTRAASSPARQYQRVSGLCSSVV